MINAKIKQGYDMWMLETEHARLIDKLFDILAVGEPSLKNFHCYLRMIVHLLSQVDIPEATSAKLSEETIATYTFSLIYYVV